jgi:phage gp46-like protein
MIDIRTQFVNELMRGEMALEGGLLAQDDSLETAIILSLFSDRRAKDDDELPDNSGDRRGWWGDLVPPVEGDQTGSRLWLLRREKNTQDTLNRAREMAEEALQWIIEDGLATKIEVATEAVRREVLGLAIGVTKPAGAPLALRYELTVGG